MEKLHIERLIFMRADVTQQAKELFPMTAAAGTLRKTLVASNVAALIPSRLAGYWWLTRHRYVLLVTEKTTTTLWNWAEVEEIFCTY